MGLTTKYSNMWIEMKGQFRLWWRSAPISEEFQPKIRLFEAMVGMLDKMEKLKLDIYEGQVSSLRV